MHGDVTIAFGLRIRPSQARMTTAWLDLQQRSNFKLCGFRRLPFYIIGWKYIIYCDFLRKFEHCCCVDACVFRTSRQRHPFCAQKVVMESSSIQVVYMPNIYDQRAWDIADRTLHCSKSSYIATKGLAKGVAVWWSMTDNKYKWCSNLQANGEENITLDANPPIALFT